VVPVHPQEVLLDVIGPAKGLVADVAMEGLLLAMDVFMAGVEIPPVGAVGTIEARVSLATGSVASSSGVRRRTHAPWHRG
jgi:hypothetical protein